ncbi:MAG: MotA/TolQ/ExbB proton channel family protein [Planctomycetota bacterium]|nr:MotA/TolQ/ExbB proton channel family protein [Planctomycetota bacterium]
MLSHWFHLGGPLMWLLLACSAGMMAFVAERGIAALRGELQGHEELHRKVLGFIGEIAPAIGLLGTMQGIIESFGVLGGAGSGRHALAGLGVACITTVFGLVIALLATASTFSLDLIGKSQGARAS